ncbi:hypothetical protein MPSEU_000687700 [Mayamaea pseudoterrestris]|nr:hypothetical protein MPSEU_000687700 [Mayamaea pseudoterrestris]
MPGRGREMNMPAWMAQQQQPPPSRHDHVPPPQSSPPDDYRRGPPQYDDRRRGSGSFGGAGGGSHHYPHARDRDYQRGPPPPHHHRSDYREPPSRNYRGPPPPRSHQAPKPRKPPVVSFRSYQEEMDWVERRRRLRHERPSKFDVMPTMIDGATAIDGSTNLPSQSLLTNMMLPGSLPGDAQQTRHARRLYIGNLPPNVHEQMIHDAFSNAIQTALIDSNTIATEDPILSVYINPERQFSFLEFKTVEMTTACLDLDGLVMQGFACKIKRPNDYNPSLAPRVHPSSVPRLDVSRLGITASSVQDGPNKIFIGGLHYHFQDAQVKELLEAFGKIKAFHLVKNEQDPPNSKGYCFVEYVDANVTPIAIQGLNGMDIGGGKSVTARLAGERSGGAGVIMPAAGNMANATGGGVAPMAAPVAVSGGPPLTHSIVTGFDVEQLVDAALGKVPMPLVPQYRDAHGLPLTRIVPLAQQQHLHAQQMQMQPQHAQQMQMQQQQQMQQHVQQQHAPIDFEISIPTLTRVLVLHNMVLDEDLATDQDYAELSHEVREECAKFGKLTGFMIPRVAGGGVEPSAIRKVYLQYSSIPEAQAAERELKGRQFGDAIVDTSYYPEADFAAGKFK